MKLTKFEKKTLEILARQKHPVSAGQFARMCWPDSPSWYRVCNVGHGATTGVGIKQAAGSHLHRLERKGLVYEDWNFDRHYSLWSISAKGLKELRGDNET